MAKKRKSDIKISDILKGKFLVQDGSGRIWQFILFLVFLAFISISSSHWVDKKAVEIQDLDEKTANLKSRYTDAHRELMKLQLGPEIREQAEEIGISLIEEQPYVIIEKIYDKEP